MVERRTVNALVPGSTPGVGANSVLISSAMIEADYEMFLINTRQDTALTLQMAAATQEEQADLTPLNQGLVTKQTKKEK